jgi:hypothetical protein
VNNSFNKTKVLNYKQGKLISKSETTKVLETQELWRRTQQSVRNTRIVKKNCVIRHLLLFKELPSVVAISPWPIRQRCLALSRLMMSMEATQFLTCRLVRCTVERGGNCQQSQTCSYEWVLMTLLSLLYKCIERVPEIGKIPPAMGELILRFLGRFLHIS